MPGADWIEAEFARTGLPRSALAEYLGLDNAAVSRLAKGERAFRREEEELAAAFFSLLPSNPDPEIIRAVRQLRTVKTRERATRTIVDWLSNSSSNRGRRTADNFLAPYIQNGRIFRADQIVALCRSQNFSLPILIREGRLQPIYGSASCKDDDAKRVLAQAASQWAVDAGCKSVYDFDRGASSNQRQIQQTLASHTELLRADGRLELFKACTPFLVPDDSLSPFFEQGQTIYLEDKGYEPRKSDLVAVLLPPANLNRPTVIVGRLLYSTPDVIVLQMKGRPHLEVARSEALEIRRIAFCGF